MIDFRRSDRLGAQLPHNTQDVLSFLRDYIFYKMGHLSLSIKSSSQYQTIVYNNHLIPSSTPCNNSFTLIDIFLDLKQQWSISNLSSLAQLPPLSSEVPSPAQSFQSTSETKSPQHHHAQTSLPSTMWDAS